MWCTRIDHIIEPENKKCSYRDLVCEAHAFEISKLGFCLNHRRLAESETMCEDCSSSCHPNFVNFSKSFGHFPRMQQKGRIHDADDGNKVLENGMEPLRCSCCGDYFVSKFYLIKNKSFWRVLDCTQKRNLITEREVEAEVDEGHHHSDHGGVEEEQNAVEKRGSDIAFCAGECSGRGGKEEDDVSVCFVRDGDKETVYGENYKMDLVTGKGQEEPIGEETLNVPMDDQVSCSNEITELIPPKHLEFFIHGNECLLIPVEYGDSSATESQNQLRYKVGDEGLSGDEDVILDFDLNSSVESETVIENSHTPLHTVSVASGLDCTKACKANGVESIPLRIRAKRLESIVEEENLEQNCQEVKLPQTSEDSSVNGNVDANMKRRDEELCSVVPQGFNLLFINISLSLSLVVLFSWLSLQCSNTLLFFQSLKMQHKRAMMNHEKKSQLKLKIFF